MEKFVENTRKWFKETENLKLDTLLEEISVLPCNDMLDDFAEGTKGYETNLLLSGWFAVANEVGIIAYFSNEKEAFNYRLNYINRVLN